MSIFNVMKKSTFFIVSTDPSANLPGGFRSAKRFESFEGFEGRINPNF